MPEVGSQQQFGKGHESERQSCLTSRKVLQAAKIRHQKSALLVHQLPRIFCAVCRLIIKGLISLPYGNACLSLKHFTAEISENLSKNTPSKVGNVSCLAKTGRPGFRYFLFPLLEQLSHECWCFQQDGWHQRETQKFPIYSGYVLPTPPPTSGT